MNGKATDEQASTGAKRYGSRQFDLWSLINYRQFGRSAEWLTGCRLVWFGRA